MDFRVGAISFLNTVPLIEWFGTEEGKRHHLLRVLPSELSEILRAGEAQVGLLPLAEILRGRSDGILGETGIACRGDAASVKVFCTCPLGELTRVRADRGSRSSVALLKIILRETHGLTPDFTTMTPDADMVPGPGEGLLIIGDRCFDFERTLGTPGREDIHGFDLGRLWLDLTGLPFVFAAWALAPGFLAEFGLDRARELGGILDAARDYGRERLAFLARREAARGCLGLGGGDTPDAVGAYLQKSLRYRLTEDEIAGMKRFHVLGVEHGLFPDLPFPRLI